MMRLVKSIRNGEGRKFFEQLEMSDLGGDSFVIAVRGADLKLHDLADIFVSERISAVFDVRIVPYLNFGDDRRDAFWNLIDRLKINYNGYSGFAKKLFIEGEADSSNIELKVMAEIKRGSVLFISDFYPSDDGIFISFFDAFSDKGLRVFCWALGKKRLLLTSR